MATMQLNVDPRSTILPAQVLSGAKDSAIKCFDMFTTVGIMINVTAAAGLTASAKVQVSIDGVTWGDYSGSTVAITGNTVIPYNILQILPLFFLKLL